MADAKSPIEPGALHVVATPIGHLDDLTHRAVAVLSGVDRVVAEDTRRTRRLLEHYGIATPFGPSLYEGSGPARVEALVERLQAGETLALVSDAGTPLVSDPGFRLVRAAIQAGVRVVPVPGPTAVMAALVASGLPTDRFVFDGTPPKKSGRRRRYFASIREEERTVVLFESRHRLLKTLATLAEILPERPMALCRELTKRHEEVLHGTAAELHRELASWESLKGEFVLVVAGADTKGP